MDIEIVKPKLRDAQGIKKLLDYYSKKQIVLPKSIVDIYEKIRTFWIACDGEKIVGCVALQFFWGDIAEVRSLALNEDYQGHGIGKLLVAKAIEDARFFEVKKVFALTYIPEFFKKLGFISIDKEQLPQKIWTECINCQHFPNCDEDAVELILLDNGKAKEE